MKDKIMLFINGNKNYADFTLNTCVGSPYIRLLYPENGPVPTHMLHLADAIRAIQESAMSCSCINAPSGGLLSSLLNTKDDTDVLDIDVYYCDKSNINNSYSHGFIDADTDIELNNKLNLIYMGESCEPTGVILAYSQADNKDYLYYHATLNKECQPLNFED